MAEEKDVNELAEYLGEWRLQAATISRADAEACAKAIRKAMKGLGTADDDLIAAICDKNAPDMQAVVDAWNDVIQRDMVKDIKGDTSGKYEDVLVGCVTPLAALDAKYLHKAIKGLGTDENVLTEILCTRSPNELLQIEREYQTMVGSPLLVDVKNDVSGHLEDIYTAVLTPRKPVPAQAQIQADAEALYAAGEGKWGTNEKTFTAILSSNTRGYVRKVAQAYKATYGKFLHEAISAECSGDFKNALVALATPGHVFFARQLYSAMKGAGTNDKKLIRILVTQRGPGLKAIATAFEGLYKKSLRAWVKDDVRGDYEKSLLTIIDAWC
mmetsp:Transcript_5263/g.6031  ORF Transcript_5263/g.6031 Transcript_5263/m.6031 type:complete len:327 (-) Transcript_5263:115-1095(-)